MVVVRIKHAMTRLQISKTNWEAELNATRAREKFWLSVLNFFSWHVCCTESVKASEGMNWLCNATALGIILYNTAGMQS